MNFKRHFSLILSKIRHYSMDSVKIKLTLLIDLYGHCLNGVMLGNSC